MAIPSLKSGVDRVTSPSILLVDDDPNVASALERNFRRYGISVHTAYHGMQGISMAVQIKPDLIITDLEMPFASGEELIEVLSRNEDTHGIPILVLTGRPDARLTSRLKHAGVVEVVHKPIAIPELLMVLVRKQVFSKSEQLLELLCTEIEKELRT